MARVAFFTQILLRLTRTTPRECCGASSRKPRSIEARYSFVLRIQLDTGRTVSLAQPGFLRRAQTWFRSNSPVPLEGSLRLGEIFEKQSLQYAGLPGVGWKGTKAAFPHCVHFISNIPCWIVITSNSLRHNWKGRFPIITARAFAVDLKVCIQKCLLDVSGLALELVWQALVKDKAFLSYSKFSFILVCGQFVVFGESYVDLFLR